ncbi:phenol hydroxylase [Azoarcus indigens]|uniref:Phenol hydroxylase P0 protein n=1 Tax=Azoarcus indigens TaxID=29545 RepID=A0A4R6DZT3_9RHOO|nr:phenol hydroxylase subunit [Azoarcus indigens]NMG64732.1 phenol hydroxylase [Azoarcus indigens]TDN50883.1 phenol hydroxylase P0 protein [Azoarcus indigens]
MSATPATSTAIDVSRKFVRLIERRADGLVEFEFAIGEPELCAELLLPEAAFQAFCQRNAVTELPARAPVEAGEAAADWNWSLHQATHQRFR